MSKKRSKKGEVDNSLLGEDFTSPKPVKKTNKNNVSDPFAEIDVSPIKFQQQYAQASMNYAPPSTTGGSSVYGGGSSGAYPSPSYNYGGYGSDRAYISSPTPGGYTPSPYQSPPLGGGNLYISIIQLFYPCIYIFIYFIK